jgi:formate/nitrite transporter FocA (FNT family)
MSDTTHQEDPPLHAPELDRAEERKAIERTSPGPHIIHEAIRIQGEEELRRPTSALAWSGLAAGLSMGFSFIAEAIIRIHLPDEPWRPLLAKLGYPLGFLIVILGRQQLFTENTLTPIIPLLSRRDRGTLMNVLRLWGTVFASNIVGAALCALVLGRSETFPADIRAAFATIGIESLDGSFGQILLRGIFAGWLIALMVWVLGSMKQSSAAIIIILTYIVGLAGLSHIIVGSVEVLYLVMTGEASIGDYLVGFMTPTLLGNICGGVALVAAVNHAQVLSGRKPRAMQ